MNFSLSIYLIISNCCFSLLFSIPFSPYVLFALCLPYAPPGPSFLGRSVSGSGSSGVIVSVHSLSAFIDSVPFSCLAPISCLPVSFFADRRFSGKRSVFISFTAHTPFANKLPIDSMRRSGKIILPFPPKIPRHSFRCSV